MLMYRSGPLSTRTEIWLKKRQDSVDKEPTHVRRCVAARKLFASKHSKAFVEVRTRLASMSPSGRACFYCERDRYRDIDHIRPIRHYPESCFVWQNYVYACAIC